MSAKGAGRALAVLLVAGTVPQEGMPLVAGPAEARGDGLNVVGRVLTCVQGTSAMLGAALAVTGYLKLDPPFVVLAGDTGRGQGTRLVYDYLTTSVARLNPRVLALHYCLPVMGLMRKLCDALDRCPHRPLMVADAGAMYAAKAAGLAGHFTLFTPDASETAFLADPNATHPAYVSRHLFDADSSSVPQMVRSAYLQGATPRTLLVKGAIDHITQDGEIVATVSEPNVPELEPIGGTGDTITGLAAALLYAGLEPVEATVIAAKANRVAGQLARATPATRVGEIIARFPEVLKDHLCEWTGYCIRQGGNP